MLTFIYVCCLWARFTKVEQYSVQQPRFGAKNISLLSGEIFHIFSTQIPSVTICPLWHKYGQLWLGWSVLVVAFWVKLRSSRVVMFFLLLSIVKSVHNVHMSVSFHKQFSVHLVCWFTLYRTANAFDNILQLLSTVVAFVQLLNENWKSGRWALRWAWLN